MTLTSSVAETAAVILIGNELLSGKVHEANLLELARTLRALGVRLERAVVIRDDTGLVAEEVRSARRTTWSSRVVASAPPTTT